MDRRQLPNDIIFHIFSFLPLKSSVRTSVLAKEWRFKWVTSPGLGFTCNNHFGECCSSNKDSEMQQQQMNYNLLNIFHTSSNTTDHNRDFESWISTVFARRRDHIRNLVIAPINYDLKLPLSLFTCETLVSLRIIGCRSHIHGDFVHFPALKELQLVNVVFETTASLGFLLSGCPVIQDLTIGRSKSFCCVTRPLVSLIKADVDLATESNNYYSDYLIKFVPFLSNVECLTLTTLQLEVPDSQFNNLVVKFCNLVELNLRADWRFITLFLKNADNLRVLTILPMVDRNSTLYWKEPKRVPSCLKSSLERLNLVDFEWSSEQAFDMIKYILKNGKLLREVNVICTADYKVKFDAAVERLARMKIRSLKCYMSFVPRFNTFVNTKEYPLC